MYCIGGQCTENSIRLVGELSGNEGYPVICYGGSWGKVHMYKDIIYFSASFSHILNTTRVLCRQLGFSTQGKRMIIIFFVGANIFSYTDPAYLFSYYDLYSFDYSGYSPGLPIALSNVRCTTGDESNLLQCNYDVGESPQVYYLISLRVKCQAITENGKQN